MLTRGEFAAALAGVRGLARLDVRALRLFDATHRGFWNSFWAAAILAPFAAITVAREAIVAPPPSLWRLIAVESIGYAIGWLAFPLVMVWVAERLGRGDRYFVYMVPYNWFHLIEIALGGPILLLSLSGLLPVEAEKFLVMLVLLALLGYEWFIAKNALLVSSGVAAMLVGLDLSLTLAIDYVTSKLP